MTTVEVAAYMRRFQLADGSKIFTDYTSGLEHFTMQQLLDASTKDASWRDVSLLVFQNNLPVSVLFKMKVKAAAEAEMAQRREESSSKKAKKDAEKGAMLAKKRAADEHGESTEPPPAPKSMRQEDFSHMFGMGRGVSSQVRTRLVEVNWNKDFQSSVPDSSGSQLQRRFRDEEEVRTGMAGWSLRPDLLTTPNGAHIPENVSLHPAFLSERKWVFELQPAALSELARLSSTPLEGLKFKAIDYRSFNKVASCVTKEIDKAAKAKAKAAAAR